MKFAPGKIILCVAVLLSGACGGTLTQTPKTCPPGRTLLDSVCVRESIADYVACVRAQGAKIGGAQSKKLGASAGYLGVKASAVAEVSERLEKQYSASDNAMLEIVRACNALVQGAASRKTAQSRTPANPAVAAVSPSSPVDAEKRRSKTIWAYTCLGVGLASIATGGVLYGLGFSGRSDAYDMYSAATVQSEIDSHWEDVDAGQTKITMGHVLVGVGAAALGFSIYQFISRPPVQVKKAFVPRLRLGPTGIALSGEF